MIQRNRVLDNQATNGNGGGMELWGGWYLDVTLDGNQVISNTATGKGGGIYIECPHDDPEEDEPINISNTVLAKNIAATGSGSIRPFANSIWPIPPWPPIGIHRIHLTRAGGSISDSQTKHPPTISWIPLWSVKRSAIYVESGSASIESTLWGSGTWANDADTGGGGTIDTGTNNYYGDPVFVDTANDDYHIQKTSPAIDKGVDTWIAIDMDNQSRPAGETDLGADEVVLAYAYVSSDGVCGNHAPCYETISEAVQGIESGYIIKVANDITYSGNFSLSGKSLTIQGGWDAAFENPSQITTLQGAPSVTNGSLTFQQVKIIP
jgi:hypothetical protein